MTATPDPRDEFKGMFDWRATMRGYRREHRLSQPEVARRAGISLSAVKACESGARHPSRETLAAILDALGMTAAQAEPIFIGAGYAGNWRAIFHDAYGPRALEWFTEEVERYAWPVFVTNEASDIIAANRAARRLYNIPSNEQLPRPEKWNCLALGSQPSYAERLDNWDEVMRFVLGLGKGLLRRHVNPERPPPWVSDAYKRFLEGDAEYITRMLRLWESAEPLPVTTRMHYRVRWRHESGQLLSFAAMMHVADVWQVFAWHDWVPEDAETLTVVQSLS